MKIIGIHTKSSVIIITDTHTDIASIRKIYELYPHHQILCLGDITSLWSKAEKFNEYSIQYFKRAGIPCLKGNHEEHIVACQRGGTQYVFRAIPSFGEYDISQDSLDYIKNLPTGFRIHFPNGKHYLAFHNRPNDLWSYTNKNLRENEFKQIYQPNENTLGVIIGHQHSQFVVDYNWAKLFCVDRLSKVGAFAILNQDGLNFQNL